MVHEKAINIIYKLQKVSVLCTCTNFLFCYHVYLHKTATIDIHAKHFREVSPNHPTSSKSQTWRPRNYQLVRHCTKEKNCFYSCEAVS